MDVMEERTLSVSLFPSNRFYHIKCCKIPLAGEMRSSSCGGWKPRKAERTCSALSVPSSPHILCPMIGRD